MKKLLFILPLVIGGLAACGDDDDKDIELSENEKKIQSVNQTYVSATVVPIYKSLADETFTLQTAIKNLQSQLTDANVATACAAWKKARQYWEWSEAFLFGAADEYSIDPHIDTWPLDRTLLEQLLGDEAKMQNVAAQIVNNDALAGFHGLEYIIFREGQTRAAAAITANEMRYAVAVVEDLVLSCIRLEAAWAGRDNISAEKLNILKASSFANENDDFGERLANEWDGRSVISGLQQIIEGFITIVDEVGAGKIGAPYSGEDVNYIESPHAYNSIQDFEDNIQGVKYGYLGALNATSAKANSVSEYITNADAAANQQILNAIDNCIKKIQAMPKPFVLNYSDPKAGEAVEACEELVKAFQYAVNNVL
jgi:predicted lipoprotein